MQPLQPPATSSGILPPAAAAEKLPRGAGWLVGCLVGWLFFSFFIPSLSFILSFFSQIVQGSLSNHPTDDQNPPDATSKVFFFFQLNENDKSARSGAYLQGNRGEAA